MGRKQTKPGPLRARVMHHGRLKYRRQYAARPQPWWVRVSYPNGKIAFKSENYASRRAAQNAADALETRGVVVVNEEG